MTTVPAAAARLLPVFLEEEPQPSFDRQMAALRTASGDLVAWLPPVHVSRAAGVDADAVIVPDMSGVAYGLLDAFRAIDLPILVVTSEFGTVSMWDWEVRDFLRRRGVDTVAPTSLEEYRDVCRGLAVRRRLTSARMLAYLDDLGAGKQPDIFKRFYWYEEACADEMTRALGVTVERRSYRDLWARALALPDARVDDELARTTGGVPMPGLALRARRDALRLKLALDDDLDEAGDVIAAGINCLNESATSTTTPCLAWNLLFEERGLIWGCEADLTSMITQFLTWETLQAPAMMTNLYPFLMGQAALAHERIPYFPDVDGRREDHILTAHCGFFGVVPQSWSTEWALRPPVLEIVDANAHAIDGRFPVGDLTIVKIASTMDELVVTPALLTGYEQYADSDCLNGAVLRVEDGYRYVEGLPSHHAVLAIGDLRRRLDVVAPVLGLAVTTI